jgi:hypothetical protein
MALFGINWQTFMTDSGVESWAVGQMTDLTAYPNGYYPTAAMVPAITAGQMTTINSLLASGTVSAANLAGGLNATSALTGSGNITSALASLIVSAASSITGSGDVTLANLRGFENGLSAIVGDGAVSATLTALANAGASIIGSGSVSITPTASGKLDANIKSYTDLSAQGAADAVWAQILETGFTAQQIMRILSAVMAGQVSGAAGTTVTIRDINNTVDRVVATVDSSGDRTAVTLNTN